MNTTINQSELVDIIREAINALPLNEDLDELRGSSINRYLNPFSQENWLRDKRRKDKYWTDDASDKFSFLPRKMRGLNNSELDDGSEVDGYNDSQSKIEATNKGVLGYREDAESIRDKVVHLNRVIDEVRGRLQSGKYFGGDEDTQRIVKNFIRACYTAKGVMTSMYNGSKQNSAYASSARAAAIANRRAAAAAGRMVSEAVDEKLTQGWLARPSHKAKGDNGGTINTSVANDSFLKRAIKPSKEGNGKWVRQLRKEVYSMLKNGYFTKTTGESKLVPYVQDFLKMLDVNYRIWPIIGAGALLSVLGPNAASGENISNADLAEPQQVNIEQSQDITVNEELGKADIGQEGLQEIMNYCQGQDVVSITVVAYEDTNDGPNWNYEKGEKLAQARNADAIRQLQQAFGNIEIKDGGYKVDAQQRGVVVTVVTSQMMTVNEDRFKVGWSKSKTIPGVCIRKRTNKAGQLCIQFWFPTRNKAVNPEIQQYQNNGNVVNLGGNNASTFNATNLFERKNKLRSIVKESIRSVLG